MRLLTLIIFCLTVQESFAVSQWYNDRNRGWFWYEDNFAKEQADEDKKLFASPKTPEEALKQIMQIRKTMEEASAFAILTQSEKNTARYIQLQKYVLDISEKFNISWQDALRLNPYLDESIKNPVSGMAKEIKLQINSKEDKELIEDFGNRYGLLVVTRGNCPYCKAFVNTLKEFEEKYKFSINSMSLDGSEIAGIKQINNAELLASIPGQYLEYVPALFAIRPETGEAILISSRLLSLDELEKRVLLAIRYKEGVK